MPIPVMKNQKILITGATSQVAKPVVEKLSAENEVHGLARFREESQRKEIEALGAQTLAVDLAEGIPEEVPKDFDYVLHFAVVKSGDFEYDLKANAEGVGFLMAHCRDAKAFLHCSSAGVYHDETDRPLREDDPLGDNHRCMMPTYSICKIAAESVVRMSSRLWDLPSIIARFSVPYGSNGGWPWYHLMMMKEGISIPVHEDGPCYYNLIHEDDYIEMIPALLAQASVPTTIMNWGGSAATSIEEWCAYLSELTGIEAKFTRSQNALKSLPVDTTLMDDRIGPTRTGWKEGIHRMVEARNPELLLKQEDRS